MMMMMMTALIIQTSVFSVLLLTSSPSRTLSHISHTHYTLTHVLSIYLPPSQIFAKYVVDMYKQRAKLISHSHSHSRGYQTNGDTITRINGKGIDRISVKKESRKREKDGQGCLLCVKWKWMCESMCADEYSFFFLYSCVHAPSTADLSNVCLCHPLSLVLVYIYILVLSCPDMLCLFFFFLLFFSCMHLSGHAHAHAMPCHALLFFLSFLFFFSVLCYLDMM